MVYMWRPDIQNFEHKFIKEINMLIRPLKRIFYKPSANPEEHPERIEFDIAKWFLKENSVVCVANCDPVKPRPITPQMLMNTINILFTMNN